MTKTYQIFPLNESAVMVSFKQEISVEVHHQVLALQNSLLLRPFAGYTACVPAYASLTVFFDLFSVKKSSGSVFDFVKMTLEEHLNSDAVLTIEESRIVEVPVDYSGEDLDHVAAYNGLKPEEVVAIHSSGLYKVYMLGFLPGFAYLGGMSGRIATPRRQSPRLMVKAGSVGIAGLQTGIYPVDSPGGWQLIGTTDLRLFNPESDAPVLLRVGDTIKFKSCG